MFQDSKDIIRDTKSVLQSFMQIAMVKYIKSCR